MRAEQTKALPSTCTIVRRSVAADGLGGQTETWTTLASGVACRLAPMSYRERVAAQQFGGDETWHLTLPYGQDVTAADRVIYGGVTYEVKAVESGGAWESAKRLLVGRMA
jgi:SPP1 family predicted phage head-tail adaptor